MGEGRDERSRKPPPQISKISQRPSVDEDMLVLEMEEGGIEDKRWGGGRWVWKGREDQRRRWD